MKQWTFLCLLLLGVGLAWAALPPLSDEERTQQSSHIVEGTVVNVSSTEVAVSGGVDREYRLNVRVNNQLKGTLPANQAISVVLRQTARRPAGWTGPQGQNEIPVQGQSVRFFLQAQQKDYRALEPNGWQPLDP
jgi:hypothetical protein